MPEVLSEDHQPFDVTSVAIGISSHEYRKRKFALAQKQKQKRFWANLVNGVIQRLKDHSFVQIRGSSASGKTILLHLVHIKLRSQGIEVLRFDKPWPIDEKECAKLHEELVEYYNATIQTHNQIVIIDEAQASYGDTTLWNTYFKSWAGNRNPYFSVLIACSWRSASPQRMTMGPCHISRSSSAMSKNWSYEELHKIHSVYYLTVMKWRSS
ncbi:hypothetical protein B0H17DRAFT_1214494 [Mycena rosella]|uniref:Uncharacterized protein n=1 Tax=Mycena rosella TaxID=1033263 RepID=A0AAD7G0C1_MYCRO|nr:hypothetical protein B0H17DRAFT_1214494 [Mycena rosella]